MPLNRPFVRRCALCVVCLSFVSSIFGDETRPNILWISAEDISPHFGCYGDNDAITPNIDQLAAEGIRYENCFTTAGVCAPCRSGIITGCYQTTLGTHHMRCRAILPEHIEPFPKYLRKAGYYCTNNSKTDYQFKHPKDTWDQSGKKAHWRNRPDPKQPFFAVFNFTGCHESGIASVEKYRSVSKVLGTDERQDPGVLKLPSYYPDTPIVREDWKRNYELITAMDHWAGDLIQQLKKDNLYDNTVIFFWSDHGVGLPRAKRWLYDSGTHIPLVVRIPEKYESEFSTTSGKVSDELVSSIDFAPTVLNLARIELKPHFQGRAFLGSNLTKPREFVFGARDRMDERYDIIRMVRNKRYKYIRNYEPFKAYYQYMNTPEKGATMKELRRVGLEGNLPDAASLFMAKSKPPEELYDIDKDPEEINNLLYQYTEGRYEKTTLSAASKTTLTKMREAHLDWVADTRDIGLIPESEIVIREKACDSRYEILRNADKDLVNRIRDYANMAINCRRHFPDLIMGLKDEDPVCRYWCAIGVGNLGSEGRGAINLLKPLLNDQSPCVRIATARALLKVGDSFNDLALETLVEELKSEHEWARLRACIVLDEAGELARPLIPSLKECLENQPNKYITRVANRTLNVLLGTSNRVK